MTDGEDDDLSFKLRLAAWWKGYDAREYRDWQNRLESDDPSAMPAIPDMPSLDEFFSESPTTARIEVLQRLFGESFVLPGGAAHAVELAKPFAMTPVHSVLDMSAGLGGPAAAVVENFGVWITGYERDGDLAAAAPEVLSSIKGGNQVTVRQYDPESFNLRSKSFDCIICREMLYRVPSKDDLLAQLHELLKDWGQILITDYVLPGEPATDGVQRWIENEVEEVHLWTASQYQEALSGLGLDLRVAEDMSLRQRTLIRDDFMAFLKNLQQDNELAAFPLRKDALIEEATNWARRAALLEKGDLQYFRFFALRPD